MIVKTPKALEPPDDISFNAIVIVQSLDDEDEKTGRALCEYINTLEGEGAAVPATLIDIQGRDDFKRLVKALLDQAKEGGFLPILHIEAHGNADSGIWFADDTCLSWGDFCDCITPLNEATGLRLLVSVAACYGSSMISGVRLSKPAPCFALIGPTDAIQEPEALGAYRDFYGAMLRTLEAGPAIRALKNHALAQGVLQVITARLWFELLMTKYLEEETTPRKVKEFAMRQYLKARAAGEPGLSLVEYKRTFRRETPGVVRRYFETFFMIADARSSSRYASMWARLDDQLERLRLGSR